MFKFIKSLFFFMLLLGAVNNFLIFIGQIPDEKAVTGDELPDSAKLALIESGIISEDEKIEYYYSEGILSFVDYGNLFTDIRVISYEVDQESDSRYVYYAHYGDISDIKFNKSDSLLDDSVIEVYENGDLSFFLVVSNKGNLDEAFYKKLVQVWKSKKEESKWLRT